MKILYIEKTWYHYTFYFRKLHYGMLKHIGNPWKKAKNVKYVSKNVQFSQELWYFDFNVIILIEMLV